MRSSCYLRCLLVGASISCTFAAPGSSPELRPAVERSLPRAVFKHFRFDSKGWCVSPATVHAVVSDGPGAGTKCRRLGFSVRNVPGEGDCMFLAVALATAVSMGLASRTRTNGLDGIDTAMLRVVANEKRQLVAKILSSEGNLLIAGKRSCSARCLLRSAAAAEGLTSAAYLERLTKGGCCGGLEGGGPELTVLSNILRRPISVYEVYKPAGSVVWDPHLSHASMASEFEDSNSCRLERLGLFGDAFVDPCSGIPNSAVLADHTASDPGLGSWGLHILVLDVAGTAMQKHALALLPRF